MSLKMLPVSESVNIIMNEAIPQTPPLKPEHNPHPHIHILKSLEASAKQSGPRKRPHFKEQAAHGLKLILASANYFQNVNTENKIDRNAFSLPSLLEIANLLGSCKNRKILYFCRIIHDVNIHINILPLIAIYSQEGEHSQRNKAFSNVTSSTFNKHIFAHVNIYIFFFWR